MKTFKEYLDEQLFDYVDVFEFNPDDKEDRKKMTKIVIALQKAKIDYSEHGNTFGYKAFKVHKKDKSKAEKVINGII